nr:probable galacturonosyltransferase 7 isoform X1 [Tanacetum cinerariifolium]
MKDQLYVARAYYPSIAKMPKLDQFSQEMKQSIQEFERILSESSSDPELPTQVEKKLLKMEIQLLEQKQLLLTGYMVNYVNNRCRIKYMFDEMPEAVEQEATIEGEDEDIIIKSHNSFLDGYFRSLDLNEECSLIKGMEDLKLNIP